MSVQTPAPPSAQAEEPPVAAPGRTRKRLRHRLGTSLVVLGALLLAYGAAVYFWRDPVTDLYGRYRQHQLNGQLERAFAEYRASSNSAHTTSGTAEQPRAEAGEPAAGSDSAEELVWETLRRESEGFYESLEEGQPVGRIVIEKLGIDPVFVNGTRWGADLSRGPGRYVETELPGMGTLTAIAGHRTTFGAPFRHIDRLDAGDVITVELPYASFAYEVVGHEIVDDEDWSIIHRRDYETLVLSACHPLFSASQRWIVYARLVSATTGDGRIHTAAA